MVYGVPHLAVFSEHIAAFFVDDIQAVLQLDHALLHLADGVLVAVVGYFVAPQGINLLFHFPDVALQFPEIGSLILEHPLQIRLLFLQSAQVLLSLKPM